MKPTVSPGPSSERPLVVAATAACEGAAAACAAQLGGRVLTRAAWERAEPPPVVVWWAEDGPGLRGPPAGAGMRRPPPPPARARPGRDLLLRALGRPLEECRVIDATAGWGVDAGVIAAAGAHVLMVERSPTMALLLAAALARWQAAGSEAGQRMAVVAGDAIDRLAQGSAADVVYLDPLYPERARHTTSAVELRWLRTVAAWSRAAVDAVDAVDDETVLLNAARAAATRRVVVKRARAATPLGGVAPSGSIGGRTTRYDIYPGARRSGA